jgi:hypothetical protein
MRELPQQFLNAVYILAEKLKKEAYCFRGTTSLVLQSFDMNVDDIDILTDKDSAYNCNELLNEILIEEVSYKESDKFISHYGKFAIDDVSIEVMGDWQIKDTKGVWTKVYNASNRIELNKNGSTLYVTPSVLELEFFAKMGRWNAYKKLKSQIDSTNLNHQQSLF